MSMPRCIRVTAYEGARATPFHVYLDTNEVEMTITPVSGPRRFTIRMKSGKELDIDPGSFERIEKAMQEREETR